MTPAVDVVQCRDARIVIRKPTSDPRESNYVASTWANGLHAVDKRQSVREHGELVDRMLDDATARVLIAAEPADVSKILGWVCYSLLGPTLRRVLHYVYVRDKQRMHGIGRALLVAARIERDTRYTFRGPDAGWLLAKHPGAVYVSPTDFLAT